MGFRFPPIDDFSFWFGFILASLVWWIIYMLRPAFQHLKESAQTRQEERKRQIHSPSGVEERYRQNLLRQAQALHFAAPLFSLDEIVEPPLLLAPPVRVEPGTPNTLEDIVSTTIPYLPAWPELASIYKAPLLTLAQALSGNSDIVLTGQTGMGKTVALAYLASRLARRDPEPGLPTDTVPFLIHVADLDLPNKKDAPLNPIIELVAEKAPVLDINRIPDFVRKSFSDGRALLLLDGTDEMTPDGLVNVVEFIKGVKRAYPQIRMVTTASTEFLDGLVTLNFIPFALAAWNDDQRKRYFDRWGDLWTHFVAIKPWAQTCEQVDSLIINSWLESDNHNLSPLELTLKTWGAYAGDMAGNNVCNALEAHILRLSPVNAPREALEMLALQIGLNTEPVFDPRKAREWIKSFESTEQDQVDDKEEEKGGKKSDRVQAPSLGLITKLSESGLLVQHRNNRMRFSHPVFYGYLAGRALSNYRSEALLDQPPWIGKFIALHFLAIFGDVTPLVEKLLSQPDRPLFQSLLISARWLRDAPRQMTWRGQVMKKLVDLLRQSGQPLGLRGQALAAFINSGDPSNHALFKQLLSEHDGELLQLAALGLGALKDVKAVDLLAALLQTPNAIVRSAACLALVNIGSSSALDIVASALLHGDENLRRSAAESLANHPGEGHLMLKEGSALKDDLMVRRAVVYGLARIQESWAEDLLKLVQVEDEQWAVRTAALEAAESRLRTNPHIPKRLPLATDSPWLIAFAGKHGLGISPDQQPTDLLLMALKTGSEEEQLACLPYLRLTPAEGVFGALYQSMYGGDIILREAVFQTLSEMAARGVDVPDPIQFGVGY